MTSKLCPEQAETNFSEVAMEFREKWNFFTLQSRAPKRREILGWVIKCEKAGIHRGTNAFWAKSGCEVFFTVFSLPEFGRCRQNARIQQN